MRSSFFATLSSKNWLDVGKLQVAFDQENIIDLVMARDLTEHAQFELQNISHDRRAINDKKEFYLNDMLFSSAYQFGTYHINDTF